jgi:tryptophanyl-tRNA synthetase
MHLNEQKKLRILTGDRPTGKLHLGHYVGTLQNRVRLQHQYETFLIIANLHMLTTKNTKEDIESSLNNARQLVSDSIAAGIESDVCTFYLQSAIPEICEMNTLFQNLVSVPMLERIPSLKDMARDANKEEMPYGLLGYPILQAADITCVKANLVPVGKDNAAHVEITRVIARRFNNLYGPVFPIPEVMVGDIPSLIGTDNSSKMSKSLNNAIYLSDDARTVEKKVNLMYTDPARLTATIPGRVERNPVFIYHDAFNPDVAEVEDLKERYRQGAVGDTEVKQKLALAINRLLEPMRVRRAELEREPGRVDEIIVEGTDKVRAIVKETLAEMKKAMGFTSVHNRLRRKAEDRRKKSAKVLT